MLFTFCESGDQARESFVYKPKCLFAHLCVQVMAAKPGQSFLLNGLQVTSWYFNFELRIKCTVFPPNIAPPLIVAQSTF